MPNAQCRNTEEALVLECERTQCRRRILPAVASSSIGRKEVRPGVLAALAATTFERCADGIERTGARLLSQRRAVHGGDELVACGRQFDECCPELFGFRLQYGIGVP
jgi:hypothetical protein